LQTHSCSDIRVKSVDRRRRQTVQTTNETGTQSALTGARLYNQSAADEIDRRTASNFTITAACLLVHGVWRSNQSNNQPACAPPLPPSISVRTYFTAVERRPAYELLDMRVRPTRGIAVVHNNQRQHCDHHDATIRVSVKPSRPRNNK